MNGMNESYWYITYRWKSGCGWAYSDEIWDGTLASWVITSKRQAEQWRLISASPISKEEYDELDGEVG